MLSPRDLLERVRLSGAPGAAAAGGVPADRAAEATAELGPVLALLDPVQEEAHRIRADAAAQAERIRLRAAEDAARRVASARALSEEWRRRAAAEVVLHTADSAAATRQVADGEAAEVLERATGRLPQYADRVAALALDLARGDAP